MSDDKTDAPSEEAMEAGLELVKAISRNTMGLYYEKGWALPNNVVAARALDKFAQEAVERERERCAAPVWDLMVGLGDLESRGVHALNLDSMWRAVNKLKELLVIESEDAGAEKGGD